MGQIAEAEVKISAESSKTIRLHVRVKAKGMIVLYSY